MVPRWLQPQLPVGTSYALLVSRYVSNSQASTAVCIVTGYCICRHKNLRVYISGDDGAASLTQAAGVHVVPIYDLGDAFSFPFKRQTMIGASSSSVGRPGRVYCNYTDDGYFGLTCCRISTLIAYFSEAFSVLFLSGSIYYAATRDLAPKQSSICIRRPRLEIVIPAIWLCCNFNYHSYTFSKDRLVSLIPASLQSLPEQPSSLCFSLFSHPTLRLSI
jgi:hypothetical protein